MSTAPGPAQASASAALLVTVERSRRHTLVAARGELDMATVPQLDAALADVVRRADVVVLDLRAVWFIDASGIGALMRADALARREGIELRLIPGGRVGRVLDLCGIDARLSRSRPLARSPD